MGKTKVVAIPEGTVVLTEGEVNSDMFKIIDGNAEVYVGYGTKQETLIGIIGKQACFGEFGLLLKKPSIYTVIAYSDMHLLRISEEDMGVFIRENQKNVLDIMRNMANTMMTMRLQIELLVKEIEAGRKPDQNTIRKVKKAIHAYGMYSSIQDAERAFRG